VKGNGNEGKRKRFVSAIEKINHFKRPIINSYWPITFVNVVAAIRPSSSRWSGQARAAFGDVRGLE